MIIDELVSICSEKFKMKSFRYVCIDKFDILWSSKKDCYGITWNILTKDIKFYNHGYKIGYISNDNLSKGMTKVNRFTYDEIINGMIESLKTNIELKDDLNIMIKKYVDSVEYEEAAILKDFLNTIH